MMVAQDRNFESFGTREEKSDNGRSGREGKVQKKLYNPKFVEERPE
jgi:hypothetical protein